MNATATAGPDITDAHQDVIAAALGRPRFLKIKGAALDSGRDVAEAFTAELTADEKTRIREALDGADLDHDALTAGLGADRYAGIWQGALTPATPDRYREAAIRAALAAYADPVSGLGVAELMAPPAAEPTPARRPTPTGLRVSTRRVAGGVDGRDFAYVGLVKLGRRVVAECGHEHANRDWSATVAGGSAKSCAESILDGARRPATAEHVAKRIRTAPLGLRPAAGFEHPAGTIEAARAAAEKNTATYLAAVAAVREHLDTLEEPLPDTDPEAAGRQMAEQVADTLGVPRDMLATDPAVSGYVAGGGEPEPRCLDAGRGHTCDSVPVYRHALTATGTSFPRCNAAWAKALDHHDRVRRDYPDGPTPPRWFTRQGGEAYAGERWEEDD